MVFDIMGAVFASINTFLPDPPTPPPPPINEDGTEGPAPELSFCQTVAMVALSLIKGMAPTIKVNGHWIGNAGTSIQHLPGIFAHIPLPLVEPSAEGEIFMGSSTVLADGSPFSYQYLTGQAFLSLAQSVVTVVNRRNKEQAPTKIVEVKNG